MIVSIPTKAQEEFMRLCHVVYDAPTEMDYIVAKSEAQAYSKAIQDICGLSVWAQIVMEADMSFDESVPVCAGIPLFFTKKLQAI
jgi:tartrate dehydratase alpha subunit/fumarate hydratase class I-like protein